jgi:hypothetical protein
MARLLVILLLLCVPAAGQTTLSVEAGYGGRVRAGRWSPVTVSVQSDKPRSAVLELRVPSPTTAAMTIRQTIGVGPTPDKYVLYAPMSLQDDPLRVTLTDESTGELLADWPERKPTELNLRLGFGGEQVGFLALTAGRSPLLGNYRRADAVGATVAPHRPIAELPAAAIGYDSVDALVLTDPDWPALRPDQIAALIAWLRAGGALIVWPGYGDVPPPLAGLLPASLGEAKTVSLLDGVPAAVVGRVGLGRVLVLPFDPAALRFNDPARSDDFWTNLFQHAPGPIVTRSAEDEAESAEQDRLWFGLSKGAVVKSAIGENLAAFFRVVVLACLVIGPVDWLLLRKLNARPWRIPTIAASLVVAAGALLVGLSLKSPVSTRTKSLAVVDQVDGRVVAGSQFVNVVGRSPTTLPAAADDWWRPQATARPARRGGDLAARQSAVANAPLPVRPYAIENYYAATRIGDAPPILVAEFERIDNVAVGTITNVSSSTINVGYLRTASAYYRLGEWVEPGKSIDIHIAREPSGRRDRVGEYGAGTPDAIERALAEGAAVVVAQFGPRTAPSNDATTQVRCVIFPAPPPGN